MKKKIGKVVSETVANTISPKKSIRRGFKQFRDLVEEGKQLEEPSNIHKMVEREMQIYQRQYQEQSSAENYMRNEKEKAYQINLNKRLTYYENRINRFSYLEYQQFIKAIQNASNKQILQNRNKLKKIEYSICFELEEKDELPPHIREACEMVLNVINEVLNKKTSQIV